MPKIKGDPISDSIKERKKEGGSPLSIIKTKDVFDKVFATPMRLLGTGMIVEPRSPKSATKVKIGPEFLKNMYKPKATSP